MAKKSFKGNPALMFITTPEPEEPEEPERKEASRTAPEPPPAGYKVNPLYIETKSRRLQLVLQPSLYKRVKAKAGAAGLSVNEYIHRILEDATREE